MLDLHCLPNQIPDEKIVYFLRRHWITLLSVIVGYAFILVAPFAISSYLVNFQPAIFDSPTAVPLIVLAGSAFFLFCWLFLFLTFIDYHLDMWIVTDKRILNIEQTGLFSRTISELRLYRIQDVTAVVSGIVPTIFNYGDVEIQTAGEKEHFKFEQIPHPNQVAKTILELSEIDRREHIDEAVEDFAMADKKTHEQHMTKASKKIEKV